MNLANIIDRELKKRNVRSLKAASRLIGISAELVRAILVKGHIPKDRTLDAIARSLEIDLSLLVVIAHQQKMPSDVKGHFLMPVKTTGQKGTNKRKLPLSQEQCDYLGREISSEEIQLVRKYRQLSDEGKVQSRGYVDYMFSTARKPLLPEKNNGGRTGGAQHSSDSKTGV